MRPILHRLSQIVALIAVVPFLAAAVYEEFTGQELLKLHPRIGGITLAVCWIVFFLTRPRGPAPAGSSDSNSP